MGVLRDSLKFSGHPYTGIVSSGNAWERRSQSYFDSGNGVPRNAIVRSTPNAAFKPAFSELYAKIHLSKIQNRKIFHTPSPHPTPLGAFGASIFASSALKLGVPRVLFLRKRSLPIYRAHRAVIFAVAQLSCLVRPCKPTETTA